MKRIALLVAALLAAGPAGSQELKIGFLAPMTGIFAQIGKDMENGFQLYLDEQKGSLAGAKVVFIVEDEEGKPPVCEYEQHLCGLFGRADWLRLLRQVGFDPTVRPLEHSEVPPGSVETFVAVRPELPPPGADSPAQRRRPVHARGRVLSAEY